MKLTSSYHSEKRIFKITKKENWNKREDKLLQSLTNIRGRKNWVKISEKFNKKNSKKFQKTPKQCQQRHLQLIPKVKGRWSEEEDNELMRLYKELGPHWAQIGKLLKQRTGKQIRDRFLNRLDNRLNQSAFTFDEDLKILKLQLQFGNRWSYIAKFFNGRSPGNIKIRYYSSIRQKTHILLFLERRDCGVSEVFKF